MRGDTFVGDTQVRECTPRAVCPRSIYVGIGLAHGHVLVAAHGTGGRILEQALSVAWHKGRASLKYLVLQDLEKIGSAPPEPRST
jgi:hypothetical protein